MTNYSRILKLLLKDMFRRRDKRQLALLVVFGFVYLIMAAGMVFMAINLSGSVSSAGAAPEFFTFLLFIDFVLTIILGTAAAVSYLFLSKDSEFFLALPVKPSAVFLAKLTVVYLTELVISVGMLVPSMITAGIAMSLSAAFFLVIPLAILAVPILAMIVISLVSMPIALFVSFFKNRGAVGSIAVIVIFATLMGLYFWFASGLGINIDPENGLDLAPFFEGLKGLCNGFYPLYMLMKFGTLQTVFGLSLGMSMLVEMLSFITILAAFFFASYFLCLLVYNKINARMLENRGRTGGKERAHTAGGAFKALVKKEWKGIIRNPTIAINTLAGVIMGPLISVFMIFSIGSVVSDPEAAALAPYVIWGLAFLMIMMFCVAINGSNTCISREGQAFYILKLLPVSHTVQIRAKHIFYSIVSTCAVITSLIAITVISIIYNAFIWWMPLLILICAEAWIYGVAALSIYFDLRSPRLDWKNVKEVVKRLKNSAVMLIWMFVSGFIGIAILIMAVTGLIAGSDLILAAGLGGFALLGAGLAVVFHYMLYSNVDRMFAKL